MTSNCNHDEPNGVAKTIRIGVFVFIGLIFAVVFAFIFGYVVQLLWNALLPGIFDLPRITYLQAVGLLVLAKLFFGSFGKGGDGGPFKKHKHGPRRKDGAPWQSCPIPPEHLQHYKDFWNDTGKEAFENYLKSRDQNPNDQ